MRNVIEAEMLTASFTRTLRREKSPVFGSVVSSETVLWAMSEIAGASPAGAAQFGSKPELKSSWKGRLTGFNGGAVSVASASAVAVAVDCPSVTAVEVVGPSEVDVEVDGPSGMGGTALSLTDVDVDVEVVAPSTVDTMVITFCEEQAQVPTKVSIRHRCHNSGTRNAGSRKPAVSIGGLSCIARWTWMIGDSLGYFCIDDGTCAVPTKQPRPVRSTEVFGLRAGALDGDELAVRRGARPGRTSARGG